MKDFEERISLIYGISGRRWLSKLPEILASIAKKHSLSNLRPVEGMSLNYVATAIQGDLPVVVKVAFDAQSLYREKLCLEAFKGHGAVGVLDYDGTWMLQQRAIPGKSLSALFPDDDAHATEIFCTLAKKLHRAKVCDSSAFSSLKQLFQPLDQSWKIPDPILSKARSFRDELLETSIKQVLLHGDLHHGNILQSEKDWVAIDPKGYIGDPAFEPAAYLCNPVSSLLESSHPKKRIASRINTCSRLLELPQDRISQWLYAKSTLCWIWSLEDRLETEFWAKLIEILP